MLLRALKDLPTAVNVIRKGDLFHEENAEQAAEWVVTGYAEAYANPINKPEPLKQEWLNATVVILASGESLTQEQCDSVRAWVDARTDAINRKVIVINTTFRRAPWADMLYACDGVWWRAVDKNTGLKYAEEAAKYFQPEQMWTQDKSAADMFGLKFIKSERKVGLSRKQGIIHQGANSTYQAINLAYLMGARRFILLGLDCKGGHWHGNHPDPINRGMPHGEWKKNFQVLARELQNEDIDVVNCSPGTALRAFRLGNLDEELAK